MLISSGDDRASRRWVIAFSFLSPCRPAGTQDPLSTGLPIYLPRCVVRHGTDGRGDGPLAGQLPGPPVGNLTDDIWKHGDRPDQLLAVIGQGVPNTRMEGWRVGCSTPQN